MSSARFLSPLLWLLALSACRRASEPRPGPAASATAALASSSARQQSTAAERRSSVHDRDLPDAPPPRPPSDHAKRIQASHILIAYQGAQDAAPSVLRDRAAAEKLADSVGLEARAGADFAALVVKYSDDPKTKANAGQLGEISRDQMTKSFTDAAFGLMVKEITMNPVETAYGFHIIKRTE